MEEYVEEEEGAYIRDLILKLKLLYRFLVKNFIYLLVGGVLGASLGIIYAYSKKPVYSAECTFVLEEDTKGGGLSQYASLASMAGINIGSGGSNGLFQGDNIIELYKSRTMLKKTLLSDIVIDGKKQLLVDRYVAFNKLSERWKKSPRLSNFHFSSTSSSYVQDSILSSIINLIKIKNLEVSRIDKKLNIISIKATFTDELFSKEFVSAIVNNVNSFYVNYKTKKYTENLKVLTKQTDSVRAALNASMGGAANAMDASTNVNSSRQVLRVPYQRKQIDVQKNSAIYIEVEKNLFATKMSLMNEKPLIQVIDEPELPLIKKKVGKINAMFFGGMTGLLLVFSIIGIRDLVRKFA